MPAALYAERFAHMALLDAMPPDWRALAYEYGLKIVHAMYCEGGGIDAVRSDLEEWRERRQRDWLRTDYLVPRSAFFAGVGGFKTATEFGPPKPQIRFTI